MTRQEKISAVVNNENILRTFANLYGRWQDECMYEDIAQYGVVMATTIGKEFPDIVGAAIATTKRPFGVKIYVDGALVHFYLKLKGRYCSLCAKQG